MSTPSQSYHPCSNLLPLISVQLPPPPPKHHQSPSPTASPISTPPKSTQLPPFTPLTTHHPCHTLSFTTHLVRNQLGMIKARKTAGPDGIRSRLLRSCADELYVIVEHLANLGLMLEGVPHLWKTSCVVPVPKTPHPKNLGCYRPVATSHHSSYITSDEDPGTAGSC